MYNVGETEKQKGKRRLVMNKDTRFARKYAANDQVVVGKDSKVWVVCKDAYRDENRHTYYRISRGSWKKYVRSDLLRTAR